MLETTFTSTAAAMSGDLRISIPLDYSSSPAGRTSKDGPFNGARFRDTYLVPRLKTAIAQNKPLVVDFDDADSYSSSFLEEAFGGLVRLRLFTKAQIGQFLVLQSVDPVFRPYKIDAEDYIEDELKKM